MKKFRRIYVVEPAHDVTKLSKHTNEIRFLTSGDEPSDKLFEHILKAISDFNPKCDAILPIGRVMTNVLVGLAIGECFTDSPYTFLTYKDGDYNAMEV